MGSQRREGGPGGEFAGFGRSLLPDSARRPLQHLVFSRDPEQARREIRAGIPVCSGIYGWLNADRSLIYVGKGKSLRHRLAGYFATRTADPKMARIRRESHTLVWEPVSHELLALIREQELIDRWRPPCNVQGKPERRQPGFICLSRGVAPTLFFARQVPARAAASFGPYAGRARLGEAIASLNYVFQLRDCPDKTGMHFSNQLQLFDDRRTAHCLRYELNSCPAPCAGNCSRESYQHHVDKALRFLHGNGSQTLVRLEQRMQQAAARHSFERACVLRDQLSHLRWLHRLTKQRALARRRLNGVLVLPGFDRQPAWLVLRSGQLLGCTDGPDHPRHTSLLAEANAREPDVPRSNLGINLLMLLSSWFKKHPDQLKQIRKFGEVTDQNQLVRSA